MKKRKERKLVAEVIRIYRVVIDYMKVSIEEDNDNIHENTKIYIIVSILIVLCIMIIVGGIIMMCLGLL